MLCVHLKPHASYRCVAKFFSLVTMNIHEPAQVKNLHNEELQEVSNQKIQGFDYDALSSQARILVQAKTSELKSLIRRSARDIIDIGQKLTEVKGQLGHGNFGAWLKAEFDWSVRTAGRFMQVSTQFESANLANLNIAVSALYLLAEPSTPEEARKQALKLAKEGKKITHVKAKAIVSSCQEPVQANILKPTTIDISAEATEDNLLTLSQTCQSLQTHSQLEPKYEDNSIAIELSVENVSTIQPEQKLEHKFVEKIDSIPKEDSGVPRQLQPEHNNCVRILNIEHQNSELVTNIVQTFEVIYTGVCVNVKGNPEVLTILFEQMQKNSAFTEKVIQQAKLLAVNNNPTYLE